MIRPLLIAALSVSSPKRTEVSHFCHCAKCNGRALGLTASGTIPRAGRTIAAPKWVKFGTKVRVVIPGQSTNVYTVEDRTKSGKGWDIFTGPPETHRLAVLLGRKQCTIQILDTR